MVYSQINRLNMDKPLDYVFVDTSIFKNQGYFKKSGAVYRLFELAEAGWIRIIMPDIAKREWIRHYMQDTQLKFKEVERKASIMGNTKDVNEFVKEYKSLSCKYESIAEGSFSEHIKRAGVIVIPTSYASDLIDIVIDKYFAKEKPFGDKGKDKEFPDAFILVSLEKYAKNNSIEKIQLFSADRDMKEFNSTLFVCQEPNAYLEDLVLRRMPKYEQEEKQELDKKDVARLKDYLREEGIRLEKPYRRHIEEVLEDASLYSERFCGADISDVAIKSLTLKRSVKNMEVLAVEPKYIRALLFVDVDAEIIVNHFSEIDSPWDGEEKKYVFETYLDSDVMISTYVKVCVEMDRTELQMGQPPKLHFYDIDMDDLRDAIGSDCNHKNHRSNNQQHHIFDIQAIQKSIDQLKNATKITEQAEDVISSLAALQSRLGCFNTLEIVKKVNQMYVVNPAIMEFVESAKKLRDSIPTAGIEQLRKLAMQNVRKGMVE